MCLLLAILLSCFPAHKRNHSNLLHRLVFTLLTCSQLLLDSYHTGKSQDSVLSGAPQFVSWVNNITLSADEDTVIKLTYIYIIYTWLCFKFPAAKFHIYSACMFRQSKLRNFFFKYKSEADYRALCLTRKSPCFSSVY